MKRPTLIARLPYQFGGICLRGLVAWFCFLSCLPVSAQFVRQYGASGTNEIGKTLLPERDLSNNLTGNLFLGGTQDGQTLIMRLDPGGNILGQWRFKVSSAGETEDLSELRYDRTRTHLLGCGLIPSGGVFKSYAFRFNVTTQSLVWAVRSTGSTYQGIHNLIDNGGVTSGGVPFVHVFGMIYGASGSTYNSNYFQLNLNTGAVIPGTHKSYACAGLSDHFSTEYDPVSNTFFSTGRWGYTASSSSFRSGIFCSAADGTKVFSRTALASSTASARVYGWDIVCKPGSRRSCRWVILPEPLPPTRCSAFRGTIRRPGP